MFTVLNAATGEVIGRRIRRPRDPLTRSVGLLLDATIGPEDGIWFDRCAAVHTLGMRARLDIFFLDRVGTIIAIVADAPRWRPMFASPRAHAVLELAAGSVARNGLRIGDRLVIENNAE